MLCIIIIIIILPSVGVPEGGKKLVIKEKKNINTPMASDPGGSRQCYYYENKRVQAKATSSLHTRQGVLHESTNER